MTLRRALSSRLIGAAANTPGHGNSVLPSIWHRYGPRSNRRIVGGQFWHQYSKVSQKDLTPEI